MAQYVLYGFKGAGSAAVELALAASGADYRYVEAASWEPGHAEFEQLKQLNPLVQIPTLVLPGGQVMTESAAILIHLGLEFPASGLLPASSAQRAQALRGLVFIAANCYSAISVIDYPERWCVDADDDIKERIRKGTRARLHLHWDMFVEQFAAQPFLSGEQPGALDFLAVVVSKWSGSRQHLRIKQPEFFATLERIEQHPRVADTIKRHWPG